jgi:hypothetical protein
MRQPPDDSPPPAHPRWAQWLNDLPAGFYLFASVVVAALIIAFVLWLEERTLALVAGVCFLGLLVPWARKVRREWAEAETTERVIAVLGFLMLVGATAANVARYFLLT